MWVWIFKKHTVFGAVQTVSIEMKRAKIRDLFIDDTLKWAYMELNLTESRVFHTIFTYNELLFGKKNASKRRDLLQHMTQEIECPRVFKRRSSLSWQ